jgi:hypothetical protein
MNRARDDSLTKVAGKTNDNYVDVYHLRQQRSEFGDPKIGLLQDCAVKL